MSASGNNQGLDRAHEDRFPSTAAAQGSPGKRRRVEEKEGAAKRPRFDEEKASGQGCDIPKGKDDEKANKALSLAEIGGLREPRSAAESEGDSRIAHQPPPSSQSPQIL